jgi:D-tyrosyl-tRNA(Tyr) deacylase
MRIVVQRVAEASVTLHESGDISGAIGPGLLAMVGLQAGDTDRTLDWMAEKIVQLRIFPDENGKMNLAVTDVPGGGLLLVPNFTVACMVGKGRRPGFDAAMPPDGARAMFQRFVEKVLEKTGHVETGVFGAAMRVQSCNDGPITFVIESQAQ